MAEEPSLCNYLSIDGGRIIGFIHFPRVLVLCEMQSVSSMIWTRVAMSISFLPSFLPSFLSIYLSISSHSRLGQQNTLTASLQKDKTPPTSVLIWYQTIWWWGSSNQELWKMWSTSCLLWPGVVAPNRVLSMGQIELSSVLMLNWIVWNGTVFDIQTVYLC